MKFTSIPDGFPPNHRRPLLIPALSIVLSMSIGLQALHAQTTGSTNVPPKKDIYELQKITATPKGDKPLPIKLETYLKWLKKVNGEPESAPVDSDIQWTADKGEPIFDPSYGASVELDFGKPFVKENTAEAKKVTVTAAYTGSACVEKSPRTKDVERIYLDFWIAETEDSEDDVLIVRDENAQPAADDKKVIHWAKVLVKHSASTALPFKLESTGEKKLYFYGEQQNPNLLTADPALIETLEEEYADGGHFWIGTEAKGIGTGKFKAQADPGTGFKDAPEEKTVNLLPVELIDTKNKILDDGDDVTIEPKRNSDDKNLKSIAWIEPHGSEATIDAPDMPQLALRVRGAETMGLKIKWKLSVEYKRSNGRVVAEDKVLIPSAVGGGQQPWHEEALDGAVEIFNHATWLSELQQKGFFGGDAELTYQLLKSDGTTLGSEQSIGVSPFRLTF